MHNWDKGNEGLCFRGSAGKHAGAHVGVSDVCTARDLGQHFPAPPDPNLQNDTHLRLAIR